MLRENNWFPWALAALVVAFLLLVWPAWAFHDRQPFWDQFGKTETTVYVNQSGTPVAQPNNQSGSNNSGAQGSGQNNTGKNQGPNNGQANQQPNKSGNNGNNQGGSQSSGQGNSQPGGQPNNQSGNIRGGNNQPAMTIIGPDNITAQPRNTSFNCPAGAIAQRVGAIDPATNSSVKFLSGDTGNCRVVFDNIPAGWAIEVDGSFVSLNNGPTTNSLIAVVPGPLSNYVVYCEDCKVVAGPLDVANDTACQIAAVADFGKSNIVLKNRQFNTGACNSGSSAPAAPSSGTSSTTNCAHPDTVNCLERHAGSFAVGEAVTGHFTVNGKDYGDCYWAVATANGTIREGIANPWPPEVSSVVCQIR